jgi:hypothetical protein
MANRNEKSRQQGNDSIGNQQGTTQTGGKNSGGQKNRDRENDTSRTSNQGRKEASGGNKKADNRGHERE